MLHPKRHFHLHLQLLLSCLLSCSYGTTTITNTTITIPTVNYFHLLNYSGPDHMPHLNVSQINYQDIINVTHSAVVMENKYLKVVLLPAMGRVYRIVDLTTGHDILWKNSIASPNGANNDLGWWLWIGGIEYTLPGQEHGFTWALDWQWKISSGIHGTKNCHGHATCVITSITEPTTGIVETLTFSLGNTAISLTTDVELENPSNTTAMYAHWTNVPFVPGPTNVLPDSTEFIIPTTSIHIDPRWVNNLGNGTQVWTTSPLRFIKNWVNGTLMGDLTTNGLENGYFGVYSHKDQEGAARIFETMQTPGCDTWSYGFHPPSCFPQNTNISNCRYAEMWGGTVTHLEKLRPLQPKKRIHWTEQVQPYRGTRGICFANKYVIANVWRDINGGGNDSAGATVALSFNVELLDTKILIGARGLLRELGDVSPRNVVYVTDTMVVKGSHIWIWNSLNVLVATFAVKI